MDAAGEQQRKLLPRWRSLSRTPGNELQSTNAKLIKEENQSAVLQLDFLYRKWKSNPSLENAVEVVNQALLVKDPFIAVGPAKSVLENDDAMPAVRDVAKIVVHGPVRVDLDNPEEPESREVTGLRIHQLKRRLQSEPRNSLLWLEKARLHTQVGDYRSAESAMQRAISSAPNNRFILRAHARFMTHRGRADEALERLRRADGLRDDPWLQAAEIAVSEFDGSTPRTVRHAQQLLQSQDRSPGQTSELASALGSFELRNGSSRVARRHFAASLVKPTDNALSQALWARDIMSLAVPIDARMLGIEGAFEARVQSAVRVESWDEAMRNCSMWLKDEPFSHRAAAESSFIASSLAWKQEKAIEFCDRGLMANPKDSLLRNNKAVALARLGRIEEADSEVKSFEHLLSGPDRDFVLMATKGLVAFRARRFYEGRLWYLGAVEVADKAGDVDLKFRVRAHWFYEEVRAGTIDRNFAEKMADNFWHGSRRLRLSNVTKAQWSIMTDRLTRIGHGSGANEGEGDKLKQLELGLLEMR